VILALGRSRSTRGAQDSHVSDRHLLMGAPVPRNGPWCWPPHCQCRSPTRPRPDAAWIVLPRDRHTHGAVANVPAHIRTLVRAKGVPPGLLSRRRLTYQRVAVPERHASSGSRPPRSMPQRTTCLIDGQPVRWGAHPSVGPSSLSVPRVRRTRHIGGRTFLIHERNGGPQQLTHWRRGPCDHSQTSRGHRKSDVL
jgi:hypothetical protein